MPTQVATVANGRFASRHGKKLEVNPKPVACVSNMKLMMAKLGVVVLDERSSIEVCVGERLADSLARWHVRSEGGEGGRFFSKLGVSTSVFLWRLVLRSPNGRDPQGALFNITSWPYVRGFDTETGSQWGGGPVGTVC